MLSILAQSLTVGAAVYAMTWIVRAERRYQARMQAEDAALLVADALEASETLTEASARIRVALYPASAWDDVD